MVTKKKSKQATSSQREAASSSQREAASSSQREAASDEGGSDEEKVQAKPKGKPKGNTAIGNRPHSSKRKRPTKKQIKEDKEAAKYDAYFETQDSDADASQQDSDAKSEGTY